MDQTNNVNGNNQYNQGTNGQIIVKDSTRKKMGSMGNWMKFLGIVGIIDAVLVILVAIAVIIIGGALGNKIGAAEKTLVVYFGISFIIAGVISFFIELLLYSSGKNYKKASTLSDSNLLDKAVSKQKTFFTIVGILTIITLVEVVFFIMIFGIAAAQFL